VAATNNDRQVGGQRAGRWLGGIADRSEERERERDERKDEERKKKQTFPNLPIFIDAD
jgi:hypothetical protein